MTPAPCDPLGLRGGDTDTKKPPKGGFFCVRARSPKLRVTELASFRLRRRQEQQRQRRGQQERRQRQQREQQEPQQQERQQALLLFFRKRSGQQRRAG